MDDVSTSMTITNANEDASIDGMFESMNLGHPSFEMAGLYDHTQSNTSWIYPYENMLDGVPAFSEYPGSSFHSIYDYKFPTTMDVLYLSNQGISPQSTLVESPSPSGYDSSSSPTSPSYQDYVSSENGDPSDHSEHLLESFLAPTVPSPRDIASTRTPSVDRAPSSRQSLKTSPVRQSSRSEYSEDSDGSYCEDGSEYDDCSGGDDEDDDEFILQAAECGEEIYESRTAQKAHSLAHFLNTNEWSGGKASKGQKNSSKLVLHEDEQAQAQGFLVCGKVIQTAGKGGRYTAKGMAIPTVGQICGMVCRPHEMERHQRTAAWHSSPKAPCPLCGKLLSNREDNLKRHISTYPALQMLGNSLTSI